jgi:hypothetical protein
MKETTTVSRATPEESAADVAREYLEIDHLNGTETFERTRNAIKAALLAAYERGLSDAPKSTSPTQAQLLTEIVNLKNANRDLKSKLSACEYEIRLLSGEVVRKSNACKSQKEVVASITSHIVSGGCYSCRRFC